MSNYFSSQPVNHVSIDRCWSCRCDAVSDSRRFSSPQYFMKAPQLVIAAAIISVVAASTSVSSSSTSIVKNGSSPGGGGGGGYHGFPSLLSSIYMTSRRILNFNNVLGSSRNNGALQCPYDLLAGQPVFSVTTPYGSPYLNMEKLTDLNEVIPADGGKTISRDPYSGMDTGMASGSSSSSNSVSTPQSVSEEQAEVRTVALYYMDPDDAIAARNEMSMLEQLSKQDIRLTTFSLTKALRHISHTGYGMLTGQPVDTSTGILAVVDGSTSTGGALRYKLVPSKRQLFYAARCYGRERVGLCAEQPITDAVNAILGNSALEMRNLQKRREKRERKTPPSTANNNLSVPHMEGYTGVPVFYCPQMCKRLPFIKQMITGIRYEIPMFLNYEDLEIAHDKMRQQWHHDHAKRKRSSSQSRTSKSSSLVPPPLPLAQQPLVEVFNLWDVVTSMDRNIDLRREQSNIKNTMLMNKATNQWQVVKATILSAMHVPSRDWWLSPIRRRLSMTRPDEDNFVSDLSNIIFIPSSRAVKYKEQMSQRGNGKARLRPMR
jgi:hypothetical protein